MPGYLERYYDAGLDIKGIEAREEIERHQVERLKRSLSTIVMTGSIPRRLGPDVNDQELALDKRRARRAAHALKQALSSWSKRPGELPLDDRIRIEGAQ